MRSAISGICTVVSSNVVAMPNAAVGGVMPSRPIAPISTQRPSRIGFEIDAMPLSMK